MANSDKNIVIIPNRGQPGQPNVVFTGNANVSMTLRVADDNSLSFENITGQLFSITNNVTSGSIFSVNDISGIPVIDANASGNVSLAAFGGNVGVGTASPTAPLHVFGNIRLGNTTTASGIVFADGTIQRTAATGTGGGAIPSGVNSASNITVTATGTDASFFPAFVEATSGNIGIRVDTGLTYNPNTDALSLTGNALIQNGVRAGNLSITNTTASTSNTTGALVVAGGLGLAGNIYSGGNLSLGLTNNTNRLGISAATSQTAIYAQSAATAGDFLLFQDSNPITRFRIDSTGTVTAGTWNGSTITAPFGGTGFASYTVGDLLYANATNSLIRLNISGSNVGAGNVLLNTGSIPTWGTVSNISITTTSSSATFNPIFVDSTTGNLAPRTSSTLRFVPSAGQLRVTTLDLSSGNGITWGDGSSPTVLLATSGTGIMRAYLNNDQTNRQIFYATSITATSVGTLLGNGTNPTQTLDVRGNIVTAESTWLGNLSVTNTTQSTSTVTGAVVNRGGQGIAGNLFVGGSINGANVNVTGSAAPPNGIWQPTTNALGFATASTERMRIDQFGNLSLGTSAVTYQNGGRTSLSVNGTSQSIVSLATGGTARGYFYADGGTTYLYSDTNGGPLQLAVVSANPMVFLTGGGERMRIDSFGNLSLGTSSVGFGQGGRNSMTINGTSEALINLQTGGAAQAYWWTSSNNQFLVAQQGTLTIQVQTANPMVLSTNALERVRITAVGAVGIGTATPQGNLHVMGNIWISNNAAFVGGVRFPDGTFQTTALNTIQTTLTFTTVNNTTTTFALSPYTNTNSYIQVFVNGVYQPTNTWSWSSTNLVLNQPAPNGATVEVTVYSTLSLTAGNGFVTTTSTATNATFFPVFTSATSGAQGVNADGDLTYNPSTNLMTLGALNITGTTVPTNGVFLPTTNTLGFSTNGGEDMRINANGNVMIGGASDFGRLTVTSNTRASTSEGGPHAILVTTGSLGQSVWMGYDGISDHAYINSAKSGSVQPIMINSRGGGAAINTTTLAGFGFYVAGTIGATGEITAFASDARLKNNVQVITNAVEKVGKIRGVTFEWDQKVKHLGFSPEKCSDVGVIAQEIEKVIPEAVRLAPFDRNDDRTSRSGENYLTVQYEKLTALLIEAVKEQQLVIEQQNARISSLEDTVNGMMQGSRT